jgi:hypothetical protein
MNATKVGMNKVGVYRTNIVHVGCRWEGIAKHMIAWLADMISENEQEKKIPGTLAQFDDMLMQLDTRHSDPDMPHVKFSTSASQAKSIKATHMIPLWIQIQIVLGSTNVFVTPAQHPGVHACIAMLLDMGSLLHLAEYTSKDTQVLQLNSRRLMEKLKKVFAGHSKSNFCFKKFHNAANHMEWCVKRFGALWVTCAGRWEHFHQVLKLMYRASSMRSREYMTEMMVGLRKHRVLALAQISLASTSQEEARKTKINFPQPGKTSLVGKPFVVNMNLRACDHDDSSLPFDASFYNEVKFCLAQSIADVLPQLMLHFIQFHTALRKFTKESLFGSEDAQSLPGLQGAALGRVGVHTGAKYTTVQGKNVHVRACRHFGPSQEPWQDNAIIEFDACDDPLSNQTQLGYVRVHIAFEMNGEDYMFVRWYTGADAGAGLQNNDNEFANHHIRNLPRLKWNPRTAACNRNFAIMPVSVLRKAAWVHEDFHVPEIFWHINSTQLHMHQDPEQAMF